jgi:hypothetical protein
MKFQNSFSLKQKKKSSNAYIANIIINTIYNTNINILLAFDIDG